MRQSSSTRAEPSFVAERSADSTTGDSKASDSKHKRKTPDTDDGRNKCMWKPICRHDKQWKKFATTRY